MKDSESMDEDVSLATEVVLRGSACTCIVSQDMSMEYRSPDDGILGLDSY